MNGANKQVCIIGCGASGIPAVKALLDRGISFDCFESSDEIGGNWVINNRNGLSAAYESLRINTSREAMQYADFPMTADFSIYPDHHQIKRYFNDYFSAFDLHRHVRFNTTVEHCEQMADGTWMVRLSDASENHYQQLIVANGHHWDPHWPQPPIPGDFDGLVMHSHSYISPYDPINLSDKNILIVGIGNSALDIACELSQAALDNHVYLSIRDSAWVLPRFAFGRPLGGKLSYFPHWRLMSILTRCLLYLSHGSPMQHGLPKPRHQPLQVHPSISQSFYDKLDQGDIRVKPNLQELKGHQLEFVDGSQIDADVVIYATGYKLSFPFFDQDFIAASKNELKLWQRMIKPDIENLYFLGLMQPLGAIMPLAEKQAKLIADVIAGRIKLPPLATMWEDIEHERIALQRRYLRSDRHTMQVDAPSYSRRLDKIRSRGERAARQSAAVLNGRFPPPKLPTTPEPNTAYQQTTSSKHSEAMEETV